MRIITTIAVAVVGAAACTLPQTRTEPFDDAELRARIASTTPRCSLGPDCELRWAAARRYLQERADFRIQTYGDDFIQTYKSGDPLSRGISLEVTLDPIGNDWYQIIARAYSNNPREPGAELRKILDFNRYVTEYVPGTPAVVSPARVITTTEAAEPAQPEDRRYRPNRTW